MRQSPCPEAFAIKQTKREEAIKQVPSSLYIYLNADTQADNFNAYYAVICFSFFSNANITSALTRHKAIKIPQLYINGILFQSIEGIELR